MISVPPCIFRREVVQSVDRRQSAGRDCPGIGAPDSGPLRADARTGIGAAQ